jgi:hypothetical protein
LTRVDQSFHGAGINGTGINVTLPPEAALSTALNVNSTAKQAKQKSLGAKKKYGSMRRAQMPTN